MPLRISLSDALVLAGVAVLIVGLVTGVKLVAAAGLVFALVVLVVEVRRVLRRRFGSQAATRED